MLTQLKSLSLLRRWARHLVGPRHPKYAQIWRSVCQQWLPGEFEVHPDGARFIGWAVVPPELRPHVGFTLNGRPFDEVDFPHHHQGVADFLPFIPEANQSGFHCVWDVARSGPLPIGPIEFAMTDRRTGRPLGPQYLPWYLNNTPEDVNLPERGRRDRVIGLGMDFNFRVGGFTSYRRLQSALREVTGGDFADYPRVLDWGCGCGRVSRYLNRVPGVDLTGVDVDPDNIAWCRDNLKPGRFEVIPLRPPTGFADGSFDCVIGISVLTHLKEPEQFLWLEELRRITRPGAILLLTFHGEGSLVWARPDENTHTKLRRHGIADVTNTIYDADLQETDYYRDTYHTEKYVRRNWGRYFRVLEIRHHQQTHQDLVILRRE